MPSQTDLDQGGTAREWVSQYLGPSVGWVRTPGRNLLEITNPGIVNLDLSTNLVHVRSVPGAITYTIVLPSALSVNKGVVNPGTFVKSSITIVDTGGAATVATILIKPISVAETIMGLTQIQITTNYGGFILQPSQTVAGWVNAQ